MLVNKTMQTRKSYYQSGRTNRRFYYQSGSIAASSQANCTKFEHADATLQTSNRPNYFLT